MANKINAISQSEIRELFDYDGESGALVWRVCLSNFAPIGKSITRIRKKDGYVSVTVNGVAHMAHRLIWIYHFGDISEGYEIDHIDRVRSNNKIGNLRLATQHQNNFNRESKIGKYPRGVRENKNRFQATIGINKKKICLGTFDTPEEAFEVYKQKAKELFGEFAKF